MAVKTGLKRCSELPNKQYGESFESIEGIREAELEVEVIVKWR